MSSSRRTARHMRMVIGPNGSPLACAARTTAISSDSERRISANTSAASASRSRRNSWRSYQDAVNEPSVATTAPTTTPISVEALLTASKIEDEAAKRLPADDRTARAGAAKLIDHAALPRPRQDEPTTQAPPRQFGRAGPDGRRMKTPAALKATGACRLSLARRSVAVDPGVAVAVIGLAAEGGFGRAGALQVEAGVVRVGHADAAVHLHHLVGDQVQRVADLGLRQRDQLGHVRAVVVDGRQRRLDAGAGE